MSAMKMAMAAKSGSENLAQSCAINKTKTGASRKIEMAKKTRREIGNVYGKRKWRNRNNNNNNQCWRKQRIRNGVSKSYLSKKIASGINERKSEMWRKYKSNGVGGVA
jgi:hypothetical protein